MSTIKKVVKTLKREIRGRVIDPVERRIAALVPQGGSYPVAIQGIQRSGTNFLTERLQAADYRIVNAIDPRRDAPRHKHFRWQPDKTTIRMDRRYVNTRTAASPAEINAICGYPADLRHIVIFRQPRPWLDSIFRWGLGNDWFASEQAFFDQGFCEAFLTEWDHYYAHWQAMAAVAPQSVMLLAYEDMRTDPAGALRGIDQFMGVARAGAVALGAPPTKVRHSPPITAQRAGLADPRADAVVAALSRFDWRDFTRSA